jgi:hypothetical protein
VSDRGILSSLRYLFADIIGEDDDTPPSLPEGLPAAVTAVASEAIHLLIDYQGTSYAQLYVSRLRRFIGRNGADDAMLAEIARLMAMRMSYEDPIRIAQLKLAELGEASGAQGGSSEVRKFRIDGRRASGHCRRIYPRCARLGGMGAQAGFDPFQYGKPLGHSPPEDRSGTAAVAAVLGALR